MKVFLIWFFDMALIFGACYMVMLLIELITEAVKFNRAMKKRKELTRW